MLHDFMQSEFFLYELPLVLELISKGVLIGLMYALIALGFVLIYKATDAINFAQGEFVMLAALIITGVILTLGVSIWLAIVISLTGMVLFSFGLERVVLRPMIGRPVVSIIMATIGLAAVLRGAGPMLFGGETQLLPLPIAEEPLVWWEIYIAPIYFVGAAVSILFLACFTWFFLKSRKGIAMRAVADNQQVAMAMGINVERYFALAWAMAAVVSALGGVIWGNFLGVDVHLALIGLKVFPVVILGGLDSIVGAIVGGIIVGLVESLAAFYLDPLVGGGTKDFAPYMLMILVLMVRPYGIFGKRIIERI